MYNNHFPDFCPGGPMFYSCHKTTDSAHKGSLAKHKVVILVGVIKSTSTEAPHGVQKQIDYSL